jgi:beta-N-acetylhexosaminidase
VLTLAGCAGGVAPVAAPPSPAASASPTAPACTPAPLAERAAAVLVVGMPNTDAIDQPLAQEVAALGVGGVFMSEPNVKTAKQAKALVDGLDTQAERPLLISTDQESGRVAVAPDVIGRGPSPRRLARQRTPEQVRTYAAELGEKLSALGINLDLAPVLDLDAGPSGGIIGDRSFSADVDTASEYGLAFAAGLADSGVTPTIKHFPGQGRSTTDTHDGAATVDATLEDLEQTDLVPFQRAIDAGAPVIMLNHLSYTALDADLPASLSPKAYALLRGMGFEGVAITDSLGMGAVQSRFDFPEAAVRAVEAGADAVLATDGGQATRMRDAIVEAVESGRLTEDRLNEAAGRVTALAGGDPVELACTPVELPELDVATATTSSASASPSASASASPSARSSARPSASPSPSR